MDKEVYSKNYFQYSACLTAERNSFPIFEQIYKGLSQSPDKNI